MKINNGKILVFLGVMHALLAVTPFAFGEQFAGFATSLFFKVSDGLLEFPLFHGEMNYANFAAFWFFYFGLLLIPVGILINYIEQKHGAIPYHFTLSYLIVVLVGVFMIPLSGMTALMLPHALYMFYQSRGLKNERNSSKE
jgi:hypothetical protein